MLNSHDVAVLGMIASCGLFVVSNIVFLALWIRARERAIRANNRPDQRFELSAGGEARQERLEQAVDAIAIEVERIAEGQRFVTRLLAEQPTAAAPKRPAERVITPH